MPHPIPQRWRNQNRPLTLPLPHLTALSISGEHAQTFLQAQLTNDLTQLPPAQSQLTAYCNPKGRTIALLRLIRQPDPTAFYAILPTPLAAPLTKRLQIFILRAKVKIQPADLTLTGEINFNQPTQTNNPAPNPNPNPETNPQPPLTIPIPGIYPRTLTLTPTPPEKPTPTTPAPAPPDQDHPWRLVDILSGIPQIYPATTEQFIPQTINLDQINALSFTKGCYPGQEIIARLRYLGKVKQRLIIATAHTKNPVNLSPGTPIYPPPSANTKPTPQKIGNIIDSVPTAPNHYTFTATAPTNLPAPPYLHLASPPDPTTHLPLPYPITEK